MPTKQAACCSPEGTVRSQVTAIPLTSIDSETSFRAKFHVYLGAKQLERSTGCPLPRTRNDFAGAQ